MILYYVIIQLIIMTMIVIHYTHMQELEEEEAKVKRDSVTDEDTVPTSLIGTLRSLYVIV